MNFDEHDFPKLALAVRHFLAKADVISRMAVVPVLYLEFPDVGTMHRVHIEIVKAMPRIGPMHEQWTYVDDHTIKFEPFAGVTIVLSCRQRFAVSTSGSIGYRDIAFDDGQPQKK